MLTSAYDVQNQRHNIEVLSPYYDARRYRVLSWFDTVHEK